MTLAELLTVVTVIAVLLLLFLPSLGGARQQARSVHCAAQLKDLGVASTQYAVLFGDWLAGAPGTSGLGLLMADFPATTRQVPGQPTQAWDWAGPIAYHGLGLTDLPEDRAARMQRLASGVFQCTSNRFQSRVYPDTALAEGWPAVMPAISYATIREFLYFGKEGNTYDGIRVPFWWNIRTPRPYRPRSSSLSRPADKIWLAEGTPWWPTDGPHEVPVSIRSRYGGAYATAGPPSSYARGYANNLERRDAAIVDEDDGNGAGNGHGDEGAGRDGDSDADGDSAPPAQVSPGLARPSYASPHAAPALVRTSARGRRQSPLRDDYAYRHKRSGRPAMQTLRFDGHVSMIDKATAIRTIDLWYPSGSQVKKSEFENGPFVKPAALEAVRSRGLDSGGFYEVF